MEADTSGRIARTGEELKAIILDRVTGNGHCATGIPGVFFVRRDLGLATEHRFDRPLASLTVQGAKKSLIGQHEYLLSANSILVVCVDMPSSSVLLEASEERPFLSIYFYLDAQIIADLIIGLGNTGQHAAHSKGVSVAKADADLMEVMLRLARLIYLLNRFQCALQWFWRTPLPAAYWSARQCSPQVVWQPCNLPSDIPGY